MEDVFGFDDAAPTPDRRGLRKAAWVASGWTPTGQPSRCKTSFRFSSKNKRGKKRK